MDPVEVRVRQWLDTVVVGLNLCPFAAIPLRAGRVRIVVSRASTDLELLTELQMELQHLDATPPEVLETTVIAVTGMLQDFADYNDFFDRVDAHLEAFEWSGDFQVASFHPHYQFAGTQPDDAENFTNRAPFPLLHLLREDSVEVAVAHHPDPGSIPEDNIRRMRALSIDERARLFGGSSADTPK